ncbi:MAG: cytochrome c [Phycisphaerales bacterium]|nr:MAG: cytochrome c [Phycisphaerales bacterium]
MLAAALLSCAGPQPLGVAIRPVDQQTYLNYLNEENADGRSAFVRWMAGERGATADQVLADDARLSATRNPFDAHKNPQAVSRGAVIYQFHCARCHGDDARGRGPSTLPDHLATDFKTFGKRLAATLHRGAPRKWFRVIRDGDGDVVAYPDGESTAMPAFGDQLTQEQIWLAITYLQSLDVYAERS